MVLISTLEKMKIGFEMLVNMKSNIHSSESLVQGDTTKSQED